MDKALVHPRNQLALNLVARELSFECISRFILAESKHIIAAKPISRRAAIPQAKQTRFSSVNSEWVKSGYLDMRARTRRARS